MMGEDSSLSSAALWTKMTTVLQDTQGCGALTLCILCSSRYYVQSARYPRPYNRPRPTFAQGMSRDEIHGTEYLLFPPIWRASAVGQGEGSLVMGKNNMSGAE
jgi:hypothetical protein